MVHGAVLEVIVLLSVLAVAQYLELHMLLCNGLCLDVVEEGEAVVVLYLLVKFVCRYSYTEDARGCVKVPRRLMKFVMVIA